jgi:hypothetical protein
LDHFWGSVFIHDNEHIGLRWEEARDYIFPRLQKELEVHEKKITILVLYTRSKPEIKYSGEIMDKETRTLENFGYRFLTTLGSQPSKAWRTAAPFG